ncbi:MAG: DNA polymerase I [Eggerthellaceae bacterium]|nr:DNA polymerase I [Eggerthellaceae bacterium]
MPKTVAVIDGNSLMHRAYHAIQTPMTAKDGTPTNAIFGFMQMLCKFAEDVEPDAVICAFDSGKPEFRMQEMPEYKAQRPPMDEELHVQFPIIQKLLESMCIPVVKKKGWEGDDILGTIAAKDEEHGFKTLLVTGDKDACQLATELTHIVTTKKGITDVVVFGPDEVMEKYGVTPEQFTDYLGLMGDSSDNIPGVPGIGPKSATKLLQSYGSIEGVYEHIDELKGKQKQNLEENEDVAYLSRQIATIVRDLDLEVDVEAAAFPAFQAKDVEEAFEEYQLRAPLARVLSLIDETTTKGTLEIDAGERVAAKDWARLIDEAASAGECIGCAFARGDVDTIFGQSVDVALSVKGQHVLVGPDESLEAIAHMVRTSSFSVLDLKGLLQTVYAPDSSTDALIDDETLFANEGFSLSLAAYALESGVSSYSYESLCERFLDAEMPEVEEGQDALIMQAVLCRMLEPVLVKELEEDGSLRVYAEVDVPLVPVLACMERTGVELDVERLRSIGEETQAELDELSAKIFSEAGEEFNIDSPKQLSHILFEVMGLTPIKKNTRGYSTDAKVMRELAKTEVIADLVLRYRELSKIKGTYIDSLPKMRASDGRLHTVFHETVAVTGRLSSSDPNLQNIPSRTDQGRLIRECFIPLEEGQAFLSADYSQIELRLLAHLSKDEHLIAAFNSGEDFHASTAARVFGLAPDEVTHELRARAKAVNFGIVYGQQAYGLSQTLDIPMSEAQEMIEMYFKAYPKVREYLDGVISSTENSGYAETMFGRKRRIPEIRSSNKQMRRAAERNAMNHPMQGSAADIIKLAMCQVQERLNAGDFKAKMLIQVHDELDFSVPEDETERLSNMVREVMEGVVQLDVPLLADVQWGPNWAAAH